MKTVVHLDREQCGVLRADRREGLINWVASLGVKPEDIHPALLIEEGEHSYLLHLSRFVRNEAGGLQLDHALDEVLSEPLVIDLGTDRCWPAWLEIEQNSAGQLLARLDRVATRIARMPRLLSERDS